MLIRSLYSIIILLWFNTSFSQEDAGLKFDISVKHKGEAYPSALVKVFKNNSFFEQVKVDAEGSFSYLMPYTGVFQLHFTGEGMATKVLELDLISDIPEEEKSTIHDWSIGEIELFKSYKDIDLTKLEKPVARIHYDTDMAEFSIDYKYTGKRKKELASVETKVEEYEKQEAVVEKQNKKEYEDLVVQGNQALNAKRFEDAKGLFEKAILLNPEGEAKQKLTAINTVLKKEEDYKNLLAEAAELHKSGELQRASEKYIAAGALKPTASLPKQKIALIAQEIKQEEQQANSFNNYLAVADKAFAEGNYTAAAENYNKALDINPDAILASKKLEQSEKKVAEQEAKEATENKFNNLLVDAKNARARGDIEASEAFLNQAKAIKPESNEIALEQQKVNAVKQEREAERIAQEKADLQAQKQKEEDFNKYLSLAEKSVASGNKKQALYFYNKAKDLNPSSEEAIAGVANAQKMAEPDPNSAQPSVQDELEKMDKKSVEYQSKLASIYPQGKTVNKSKKGNKEITQVIVVKGSKGTEYQKIKYNWGGVYYFRNGDPITKLIWDKATQ